MILLNNLNYKAMRRGIIILMALMVFPIMRVSSQNPDQDPNQKPGLEKLNAYKIAFFTRRLNLTSQEAERFWPVYNEFQDRRIAIQTERQKLNRYINQNELNMSEKEMIEAGDKHIALQVQEAALAQEFHKRFREILSPAKVLRLYQAENQYRLLLLNELKDNGVQRNNPPKKGPGKNLM
jgi:hypothetical protein